MNEKSRAHKALDAFRQSTTKGKEEDRSLDDEETNLGNAGHRLRPQRSLADLRRKLHLGKSGPYRQTTQLPNSPPHSPSFSPHRHDPMHSTGGSSSGNTDALLSLNHPWSLGSLGPSTHASCGRDATGHQPGDEQANRNDDDEEVDPAVLGSFDYHKFLCDDSTRKTALVMSPTSIMQPAVSTPTHSSNIDVDNIKHSNSRPAFTSPPVPSHGPSASSPSNQQVLQQKLKPKQSLPLLGRRIQRLQENLADTALAVTLPQQQSSFEGVRTKDSSSLEESRIKRLADHFSRENTAIATHTQRVSFKLKDAFTTPDTATATSTSIVSAPVLIGGIPFPSRSESQQRLPGTSCGASVPLLHSPRFLRRSRSQSQMSQKPLSPVVATASGTMSRAHQESPTPGPAGSISYKEIDPEKLKPFIGPLTKQQPPPTKPLPHPPVARMRRFDVDHKIQAKTEEAIGPVPTTASKRLTETESPSKQSVNDKTLTTDSTDSSIETKIGQTSVKDKRTLLRKKVSTLFGEENCATPTSRAVDTEDNVASVSTYRPISMNSLDADDNSFSDIFDDVFNAARDSASESQRSAGPSCSSARPSLSLSVLSEGTVVAEMAPRASVPVRHALQSAARNEVAERLAARLGMTDSASRVAILEALAEVSPIAPPPLSGHPAIRGDLPLQARLGMITDSVHGVGLVANEGRTVHGENIAAMSGLHVPPLNVGRQRPTQVAVSTRHASRSTVVTVEPTTGYTTRSLVAVPDMTKGQDDVDLCPAFDRSVDVTWYRYAKDAGRGVRESSLPFLPAQFDALSTVFMVKYSRGRESKTTAYDHLRRFAYFELNGPIRFKIMEKLLEDHLPGKPVLLNHSRQAAPAWSEDAFATLWEIFEPLQNVLWACPRLRADVMTALFMLQPFHVIFSPFVKPITQPLPTKWLFKYLYFMQDVRVELDMTKLGFGQVWQATGLSTRLWEIGNLVHVFVEEMLKRDPRTNPMGQLTIHCRRFFGYRQGDNPHRGDVNFYKVPAGEHDEQKPGNHPEGQPWNYGRKSPSLPPSANNPYSGHRRHHAGGPDRVPFLHEGHLTVAKPFHQLTGRVCSVRMVGMSEKWSMDFLSFWPKSEYDEISKDNLGLHIDRYTPSRHSYAAPGHAIFLDYGVRAGVHRYPPLPDSEPMVCTVYDDENDVFLEVGSGNILTVKEDGVEIIARSKNAPIPRADLPFRGGSPISLDGITVPPSRIPGPVGAAMSPTMQAMRKGTPRKASQLLGVEFYDESVVAPGASPTLQGDEEDEFVTPTASRVSSAVTHASRHQLSAGVDADNGQPSQSSSDHRRSSSTSSSEAVSSNNSYIGKMSGDRREPSN